MDGVGLHRVATRPVVYKGTTIRRDGISITKCEPHIKFQDAVALLMSVYFVYVIEYPKKLKNFYIYMELHSLY